MRYNRNKKTKPNTSKTTEGEETTQAEDLIIMDDLDAVRSILLHEREENQYLRNEVKSLRNEIKKLKNSLEYYSGITKISRKLIT